MKKAKIGAVFIIAIIGLAGATTGYAWWNDDLKIYGTITTGTFGAEWSLDCAELIQDKDIATILAVKEDPEGIPMGCADCRYKTLHIDLTDVYPSLGVFITTDILYYGSVPAHLVDIVDVADITYADGTVSLDADWPELKWMYIMVRVYDADGTTIEDLELEAIEDTWIPWVSLYDYLKDSQWHQGYHLYMDIYIHFIQSDMVFVEDQYGIGTVDCSLLYPGIIFDVPKGATIGYTYTFDFEQYNYNGIVPGP